jgi:predicted DNA-binding transcriptional regulator YafY
MRQTDTAAGAGPRVEETTGSERLVKAILARRVVTFFYRGLARTVEPHMLGLHEAGESLLVAYQTGGASGAGELPGWRTFLTSEIERVEVSDREFPGPRPDFDPAAHGMIEVFARA